ncbi:MAG: hypothetical protein HOP06_05805 [Methylotenera sp.]|nr:hypothetical protein [Methylotenera sp.]
MSYLNRFAICLLLAISLQAIADTKNLDSALSERTQLEFCATYAPCAIAVGIMDASSASLSYVDKVKAYFSTFGNKPVKSEAEFKAYLTGLNPSQRQAYVNKCLDARGTNMRDYCEKEYLTESELKKLELSRIKSTPQTELEIIEEEKKKLEALDSKLYNELSSACPSPNALCYVSSIDEGLVRLNLRIEQLNSNPLFRQKFGQFVSKALNRKLIGYELDNGRFWSTRATPTKQAANAWDNLPSRQPSTTENKNLQALVETNNTANANNPYAGVSDQLNQETIDKKAKSYALTSGIIFGAIDVVNTGVAVAAINRGQKIEQEAERQRQVAMQRAQAERQRIENTNNQAREQNNQQNSNQSQDVGATPENRQYDDQNPSDIARQSDQTDEFQAQEIRRAKINEHHPEGLASSCVSFGRPEGAFSGLKNNCSFKINLSFCNLHPTGGATVSDCDKYGLTIVFLNPGQTSTDFTKGAQRTFWFACKEGYSGRGDDRYVSGSGIQGKCTGR